MSTGAPAGAGRLAYPALVVVLTGVAYAHLLASYFWADDFYYLYLLDDRRALQLLFTAHGGHVQPFRNLIFALLHLAFGMQSVWIFAVVLLTHLLNVLLLFALLRSLTESRALAAFGASLWGIDPLADGSLAWLSVYGHALVGTLVLAVLVSVQHTAAAAAPPRRAWLWYLGIVLASLSFGTGIGIALVFPVVLSLWLPGAAYRRVRRVFWSLPLATVALYLLFQRLHTQLAGRADNTVPFVLQLLGPLWQNVPAMALDLFLVSIVALLSGPFQLAAYTPAATAVAIGFAAGIVWVARRGTPTARRALWGALAVSLGAYGMIALGRGPEAPVGRLTVAVAAQTERYHYVGSIGVAIALCLMLDTARRAWPASRRAGVPLLALWSAAMLVGLLLHSTDMTRADACRTELAEWRAALRNRASQAGAIGRLFAENWPLPKCFLLPHLLPGQAAAYVVYFPSERVDQTRVYFVEPDAAVVNAARAHPKSRTAGLLITAEERRAIEQGAAGPPPP